MVDQTILQYLQQNLSKYTLSQLNEALLKAGYAQSEINAAIDYLHAQNYYNPQAQQLSQPTKNTIVLKIMVALGIILVLAGGLLFFLQSEEQPGEQSNEQPNTRVNEPRDTGANNNDGDTGETSTNEPDDLLADTSDVGQETNQNTNNNLNQNTNRPISDSDRLITDDPVVFIEAPQDSIALTAQSDPQAAADMCEDLSEIVAINCLKDVARSTQEPTICDRIEEQASHDRCLLQLAIDEVGERSLCDLIIDEFSIRSCRAMYDRRSTPVTSVFNVTVEEQTPFTQEELEDSVTIDITEINETS